MKVEVTKMKVSDIYKCGNVFETFTNVIVNDSYTNEVFNGNWSHMPETIMNAEVDFWNITKIKKGKTSIMATEIFVSLK